MRRLVFFVILIGFVSGCAKDFHDRLPTIHYGEEACRQCRMSIDDAKFACALIDERGLPVKFDDIGCMNTYENEKKIKPAQSWVHDYKTGDWLETAQAIFIFSKSQMTPMGYGLVAFSDPLEARRYSLEKQGQVVSWEDMGNKVLLKNKVKN